MCEKISFRKVEKELVGMIQGRSNICIPLCEGKFQSNLCTATIQGTTSFGLLDKRREVFSFDTSKMENTSFVSTTCLYNELITDEYDSDTDDEDDELVLKFCERISMNTWSLNQNFKFIPTRENLEVNIHGRGIDEFGEYSISGVLSLQNMKRRKGEFWFLKIHDKFPLESKQIRAKQSVKNSSLCPIVLEKMKQNKTMFDLFYKDPSELPNYTKIIKYPLCLKMIETKLEKSEYSTEAHFYFEICIMLRNAMIYYDQEEGSHMFAREEYLKLKQFLIQQKNVNTKIFYRKVDEVYKESILYSMTYFRKNSKSFEEKYAIVMENMQMNEMKQKRNLSTIGNIMESVVNRYLLNEFPIMTESDFVDAIKQRKLDMFIGYEADSDQNTLDFAFDCDTSNHAQIPIIFLEKFEKMYHNLEHRFNNLQDEFFVRNQEYQKYRTSVREKEEFLEKQIKRQQSIQKQMEEERIEKERVDTIRRENDKLSTIMDCGPFTNSHQHDNEMEDFLNMHVRRYKK